MRLQLQFMVIGLLLATAASSGVQAAGPDWPKSLTLATASPGGVYYVYGEELTKILTEKLGIAVNPLPTQGPVQRVASSAPVITSATPGCRLASVLSMPRMRACACGLRTKAACNMRGRTMSSV